MPKLPFKVKWSRLFEQVMDESKLGRVEEWLFGKGQRPEAPNLVFRGIPKGSEFKFEEPYTHATPWFGQAARGGKGAFGDPRYHDIYAYPVDKKQLYYRGGSLAGDPLESTALNTIQGMEWDDVLDLVKAFTKNKDPYYAQRAIRGDLYKAMFETDMLNRPGIWRDQQVPSAFMRRTPRLRSVYDIMDTLDERLANGLSMEEALGTPEGRILERTKFFDEWKNR